MKRHEVRRRNHYVWAYYLKGWSVANQEVFHRAKKGVIASSVRSLGCGRDFYMMSPLGSEDVEFVKCWISKADEPLRSFHSLFLDKMIDLSRRIERLSDEGGGISRDVLIYNTVEDIHTRVELDVRPVFDELRKMNFSAVNFDGISFNNFHSYMGHQFARTKYMRKAFVGSVGYERLVAKNWWLLSVILGVNVGYSIAMDYQKKKVVWLVNNTDVHFLTSDNPVINMHPSVRDCKLSDTPPDNVDFYFPISPCLAYMVNESDSYGEGVVEVDRGLVEILNRNMLMRSDETVFGDSKEVIAATKV